MYGSVRRGISLLLMVLLAVTAVGAVAPREARAAGGATGPDGLPASGSKLTFGSYIQQGSSAEPIDWIVLSATDAEVFLLSEKILLTGTSTGMATSLAGFYSSAFSSAEQSYILNSAAFLPTDAELASLTSKVANTTTAAGDGGPLAWWLSVDGYIDATGVLTPSINPDEVLGIRPAIKIDRNKVVLYAGTSAGTATAAAYTAPASGGLVLLDSNLATGFTYDVASATIGQGGKLTIPYQNAPTGSGYTINAKLSSGTYATGTLTHTATLVSAPTAANGIAVLDLSNVAAGSYDLTLYVEQAGYASAPLREAITVSGTADATAPTVSTFVPASGATDVATSTTALTLNFDETVYPVSGANVTVTADSTGHTIAATAGGASGTAFTYTLSSFSTPITLSAGKTYTVSIPANAFVDRFGNYIAARTSTFTTASTLTVPVITGPTAMSLTTGYTATNSSSAGTFTITGSPDPVVTKQSGDAKISWNTTTKQFDIAVGLAAGTYPVVIRATNSQGYDEHTFTLTVNVPANTAPSITGSTTMTLVVGYSATTSSTYTITGNPSVTTTKTSGSTYITWDDTNKRFDIAAGLAVGTYPVVITATNGITPNATLTFTLTVQERDTTAPVIHDVTATPDSYNSARLYVYATDALPLTYQWQVYRNGTWQDISGATSAEYYYRGLNAYEEYAVRVIVRDSQGNESISYRVVFTLNEYNSISGLPESYTLYVDGSVTWSPTPTGGNWSYDSYYLTMSRSGNSVTFTARNEGSTTVTYTVGGVSYSVRVYINEDRIPQTGELLSPLPAVLVSLALLGLVAYMVYKKRRDA